MALGDFWVVDPGGRELVARKYQTKAGQTAIKAGEWVIQDTAGDVEYVQLPSDGASNTSVWCGVAASSDTVTASADGVVHVFDNPNYIFRGKPTTSGNLATSIILTQVTLDIDGSNNQTVDENDTTNGTFIVRGYDSAAGTIDVQMALLDHISEG